MNRTVGKVKYYAIKQGFDFSKNEVVHGLILSSWDEAKRLVMGVSERVHGVQPEYKSFSTMEDAEAYLDSDQSYLIKKDENYPRDGIHCYVDGSYSDSLQNYSYGLVIVENGKLIHKDNGVGKNREAVSMHQIAGELLGAMHALLYAKKYKKSKVVIFFDYKGVCLHATGEWKRKTVFAEQYYQWMQRFFREHPEIEVVFCKVDAHTGDEFNDLADSLAKQALGII